MKSFQIRIVTPEKKVWEGDSISVVAPMLDGYLGIWANHAPLLGALGKGKLQIKISDFQEICYDIQGGFLEVLKNQVTLLADQATLIS